MNNIIATTNSNSIKNIYAVLAIVAFVLLVFYIVTAWKVFRKAGKPGWAAIIPYYNAWVTFEIGGKPGWWALVGLISWVPIHSKSFTIFTFLVYLVTIVMSILATVETGKRFGKKRSFTIIFLILLPFIGWPILAFGKAQYRVPGEQPEITSAAPTPIA